MSDESLMDRITGGDREALAELFRRHQKPLYNFFLRGFGHTHDAEDLAMETLLRVFRAAAQFRGRGSFRGWLYRTALNVARDRARRHSFRLEVHASSVEQAWSNLEADAVHGPEQSAFRGDLTARVRGALRSLPERDRTALLLREYQQLSHAEIATALGMTVPAVKMLLYRARNRVRKDLETGPALELLEAYR